MGRPAASGRQRHDDGRGKSRSDAQRRNGDKKHRGADQPEGYDTALSDTPTAMAAWPAAIAATIGVM
jgi:hypothetical protein